VKDSMTALFDALDPHRLSAILQRATLVPYVVRAYAELDGASQLYMEIMERPVSDAPVAEDIVPAGATMRWGSVFSVARFDAMDDEQQRERHSGNFAAYLKWRKAKVLGKRVDDLRPWTDYDPASIDERTRRWVKRHHYVAGD
jgi:hypothetical protein